MKAALEWLFILAFCVVEGCGRPSGKAPYTTTGDKWSMVASVDALDGITHAHVTNLLHSKNIDCALEGSVVYGVSVPAQDAARTLRLLRRDLQTKKYRITLYENGGKESYSIPEDAWTSVTPGVAYDELIRHSEYRSLTDVGAVLRHKSVTEAVRAFPYVVEVRSLARSYLGPEGLSRSGHEVVIKLTTRLDAEIGGARLSFQVADGGNWLTNWGSSEWWKGEPEAVAANQKLYDKRTTR